MNQAKLQNAPARKARANSRRVRQAGGGAAIETRAAAPEPEAPARSIDDIKSEIAWRIQVVISNEQRRWRDCKAPACRRARCCRAPHAGCSNPEPMSAPPSERQLARTKARFYRALQQAVQRNEAAGQ